MYKCSFGDWGVLYDWARRIDREKRDGILDCFALGDLYIDTHFEKIKYFRVLASSEDKSTYRIYTEVKTNRKRIDLLKLNKYFEDRTYNLFADNVRAVLGERGIVYKMIDLNVEGDLYSHQLRGVIEDVVCDAISLNYIIDKTSRA